MPSGFMATQVGQFLTRHFPTGVYLQRFSQSPVPLYEGCEVSITRAHLHFHLHPLGVSAQETSGVAMERRGNRLLRRERSRPIGVGTS